MSQFSEVQADNSHVKAIINELDVWIGRQILNTCRLESEKAVHSLKGIVRNLGDGVAPMGGLQSWHPLRPKIMDPGTMAVRSLGKSLSVLLALSGTEKQVLKLEEKKAKLERFSSRFSAKHRWSQKMRLAFFGDSSGCFCLLKKI